MDIDHETTVLYENVARVYAERFCSQQTLDFEQGYVERLGNISLVPNGLLLDVGCGPAVYWELARRCNLKYVGLDFVSAMLREGRSRYPTAPLARADARSLPVASRSVDFVVAMGSLSHMPNGDFVIAVAECARVLRQSGGFLLGDQLGGHPLRVSYPLSRKSMINVFPRRESWYKEVLTGAGFEVLSSLVRDPEGGEIPLRKLVVWARLKWGGTHKDTAPPCSR